MFDIGFAELVIIGVVSLLVIGPERLPGTVRMVSAWLGRLRRGFNEIKQEVQQELHNDEVMRELRKAGEEIKQETDGLGREIRSVGDSIRKETDGIDRELRHVIDGTSQGADRPENDNPPGDVASPAADAPGESARIGSRNDST
jgi:sec-independent protein translocase protein TatB